MAHFGCDRVTKPLGFPDDLQIGIDRSDRSRFVRYLKTGKVIARIVRRSERSWGYVGEDELEAYRAEGFDSGRAVLDEILDHWRVVHPAEPEPQPEPEAVPATADTVPVAVSSVRATMVRQLALEMARKTGIGFLEAHKLMLSMFEQAGVAFERDPIVAVLPVLRGLVIDLERPQDQRQADDHNVATALRWAADQLDPPST